ncbi:MAG: hypothetical protein KBT44_07585 [Bacteroidales bacterium]|nr:hypothetical protein [Candidatus Equibacterium intestinale]
MKGYYHMYANGSDARNFIIEEVEFVLAFNRVGLCCYLSGAVVVSFSIEDSHPHILLWGTYEQCLKFKRYYEEISRRCIARRRGSLDGVVLCCRLDEVQDTSYLMNVAVYTIVQPTKDGKAVMPYDYLYGSGALYFRSCNVLLPWMVNDRNEIERPVTFGSLTVNEKRRICGSKSLVPDDWLVCRGFILPTNYVDVKRFESIYKTHNCYRVFLSSGKDKLKVVQDRMAQSRGLMIEDIEARKYCESACMELFGRKGTRHITPEQRITLARELHRRHGLCCRQLSTLTKLPEEEIRNYVL